MRYLLYSFSLFCTLLLLFTSNKVHACSGKDIIFTNITFTSIADGTYNYSYEIKNIGTADIVLGQIVIQNYVSADDQVGSDAAAGGTFISYQSPEIISPGETYSGMYEANPFPENPQSTHPYLISNVYLSSNDECDVSNNYFTKFVQVSTAIANPFLIENALLDWDIENKSFTVREWAGRNSDLKYNVFSTSGVLMLKGNAEKNEPTLLKNLNAGIYIIHLSDGEKVYSKKIEYLR